MDCKLSVEELVAGILGIPRPRVVPELEYQAIPEWDSMAHVNLMLALEDRLGTVIDADQMVELTSVRAILAHAARVGGPR